MRTDDCVLTFPPWAPRTAKQKSVDSALLSGILKLANAAAWPSMGWLTLRSTEYSCIAPTTRFCCGKWHQHVTTVHRLDLFSSRLIYSSYQHNFLPL